MKLPRHLHITRIPHIESYPAEPLEKRGSTVDWARMCPEAPPQQLFAARNLNTFCFSKIVVRAYNPLIDMQEVKIVLLVYMRANGTQRFHIVKFAVVCPA